MPAPKRRGRIRLMWQTGTAADGILVSWRILLSAILTFLILSTLNAQSTGKEGRVADSAWDASVYCPRSVSELVGKWSYGTSFECATFDLFKDGSFRMRSYSDVITRESSVLADFAGTYRLHGDTVTFYFLGCDFQPNAPEDIVSEVKSTLDDLLEWRTYKYGVCTLKRIQGHLFFFRWDQKDSFLRASGRFELIGRTQRGKPFGRLGLMKGNVDMTKPNQ
jgi:hypothetical protein